MYALAVAKRKGSKQAAAELDVLAAKMKARTVRRGLYRSQLPAEGYPGTLVCPPADAPAAALGPAGPGADRR